VTAPLDPDHQQDDREATGLVLAAGGGRRLGGRPKALLTDADGTPWLSRTVARLHAAGCAHVLVVLGAAADEAAALVEPGTADVVVADDWADGMGVSLRRGLVHLERGRSAAVLVTLVDLPDVDTSVMRRVLERWRSLGAPADALVRATYQGRPGHPVLVGRDHWPGLTGTLGGDVGASPYLSGRRVHQVSCDDLATGHDLDRPEDLTRWSSR
jgi:CTP:molybdopterin cytidylyltransferase MocA